MRFTVRLEHPEPGGALFVGLPGTRRGRSGLPGLRGPARLAIRFRGNGLEHGAAVEHVGLAAGTYSLPLTWGDGGPAGHAQLRVLAPAREGPPATPWRAMNVSLDGFEQSEAFATVVPGDPQRIAVAANPGGPEPSMSAWLSEDGGATWARHPLPELLDVPGGVTPETGQICCDPMFAATPEGDIWFGGILEPESAQSRVVVNRLRPGGFAPLTVGLPARTGGAQDKPMMTALPDGRLMVVWLEPDADDAGALNVVLSACHTGLGPEDDPGSWCEEADHWTAPVDVTPAPGSYTYPDVAATPDGTVYVTWWDFSAMENGVRGAACAAPCLGAFSAPQTVALLDSTGGRPLPFGCPILVAPGGRVGAAPAVETDPEGRVWVAWGDLRAGSGTTRCEEDGGGGYTPPRATHLSWDAYVVSGSEGLPGGPAPSAAVGTPLLVDGDEGVAASSDDFLPGLAVDPTSGEVWGSAYSTGHDPRRESAHYVVASVAGGRTGPANRVSAAPSSFTGRACCHFANDFGDYAGLAATDRVVVPAWIDNRTDGDAELWAGAAPLATVGYDLVAVGVSQEGGTLVLRPTVRNTGTRTATPAGTLEGLPAGTGASRDRVAFPALAPGADAAAIEPLTVSVPPGDECRTPLTARLRVSAPEGTEALALSVPVDCGRPPEPTPAPEPTATPGVPLELAELTVVPGQRLGTVLRRGLLVAGRCTRSCRANVSADLGPAFARRTHLRRRIAFAAATFGPARRRVRLPVRARARRLLARRTVIRLRVRAFTGPQRRTRYVALRR